MSETTRIAWATSTFNPWIGCTKVGPGCTGCYAEALMDKRMGRVKWGAGQKRRRTSATYWDQPLAWNRKAAESGQPWRVFCGSLCDVFDNEVPDNWRADLLDLIGATPSLTWLLLTKRIGNAAEMIRWAIGARTAGWARNVWIGATVVNQEEADRDIPKLLRVPAAVRFLSIEPMLGPIDLSAFQPFLWATNKTVRGARGLIGGQIDWVIVGGESDQPGHKARPFDIAWARDIVRQCKAAGVPVFVKQLGSQPRGWCAWNTPECVGSDEAARLLASGDDGDCVNCGADEQQEPCEGYGRRCVVLADRAGADPSEWPEDLRVREFPR